MLCYAFFTTDPGCSVVWPLLICMLSEVHALYISFTSLPVEQRPVLMVVAITFFTLAIIPVITYSKSRLVIFDKQSEYQHDENHSMAEPHQIVSIRGSNQTP